MISVLVPALNAEATLAACLAPLVPAAVDGLVRDVIVADMGSADATLAVADDAGATLIRSAPGRVLAEGLAAARCDWLLILDARLPLAPGWEKTLARHMALRPDRAGRLPVGPAAGGAFPTILGRLGLAQPASAWLAPRALLKALPANAQPTDLARRLAGRISWLSQG